MLRVSRHTHLAAKRINKRRYRRSKKRRIRGKGWTSRLFVHSLILCSRLRRWCARQVELAEKVFPLPFCAGLQLCCCSRRVSSIDAKQKRGGWDGMGDVLCVMMRKVPVVMRAICALISASGATSVAGGAGWTWCFDPPNPVFPPIY